MRALNLKHFFVWVLLLVTSLPLRADILTNAGEASPSVQIGLQAEKQEQYKQAYEAYKNAHDKGEDLGTALMATLLMKGLGVKSDPIKAKLLFEALWRKYYKPVYTRLDISNGRILGAPVVVACLGLAELAKKPKNKLKLYLKLQHTFPNIISERPDFIPYRVQPIFKMFAAQVFYQIGMCYKNGIGTHVNLKKAKKYLMYAVGLGNDQASKALDTLPLD
ncbi:SEL1-like repeat protein [Helicobacter bizzozeronii]|uniref:sel1 repeat family protein n=1 Tax=Helicobacter bizzozeronii TaxID=56877 RepID=UPI000CF17E66|nr:sel1 repeat family protein [Helicobacter bizzozeronii]